MAPSLVPARWRTSLQARPRGQPGALTARERCPAGRPSRDSAPAAHGAVKNLNRNVKEFMDGAHARR
jgi:hypothetical protein